MANPTQNDDKSQKPLVETILLPKLIGFSFSLVMEQGGFKADKDALAALSCLFAPAESYSGRNPLRSLRSMNIRGDDSFKDASNKIRTTTEIEL